MRSGDFGFREGRLFGGRGGEREVDDETRTAVYRREDLDRSAVLLDDIATDVQTQPQARDVAAGVGPIKAVEEVRAVLQRDAETIVAYLEARRNRVPLYQLDLDSATERAEPDRILQQVVEHLLDSSRVD